jgi:hypothetical protein
MPLARVFAALPATALAAHLGACPVEAHVSLEKPEAPRGTSYKAVLKVPHGCDGSPTTGLTIALPDGFIGAKPMPKPGWTIDLKRGPYSQSYAFYHGKTLAEGVTEIRWSGGSLPDDYYDEFVAQGFLAKELAPGATLAFKVTQTCAKGEMKWIEVPAPGADPHSLEAPAALLKIAADGGSTPTVKIGAITVGNAWARATAEGAKVGAGYVTLTNTGATADTLVSVETSVAGRAEIHEMSTTDDGVMRMRQLKDGLEIPAGGSAELKPGGTHLMLLDLKQPLAEGQTVSVKLTFKSGAVGSVDLAVKPIGATGGEHDHN